MNFITTENTELHGGRFKFYNKNSVLLRGLILFFSFNLIISCTRATSDKLTTTSITHEPAAYPMAILQTGEYPLWFMFLENGPVHIESIEDAVYSTAFVPWTLALHVRFLEEREGALFMAVNRDGFLKIESSEGLTLYRFPGGDFWRQYTVGGFIFYDGNPAALLYLDDRFLDSDAPFPQPRTWTFDNKSNTPYPINIPALELFPAQEGWDVDTLRFNADGFFYYRAAKRNGEQRAVRMFRTTNLSNAGDEISPDVFFNSAPRRTDISHPSLPPLPEGFFYTEISEIGDSLFACWEEQDGYSIGAAGFMAVKK